MNKNLIWILALALGVSLVLNAYQFMGYSGGEVAEVVQAPRPPAQNAAADEQIEALENANRELTAKLDEANAAFARLEAQNAENEIAAEADSESEPSDDEESDEPPSMDELRERIRDNAAAQTQVTAIMEMVYKDLFNALQLEPGVKASLRELVKLSLEEESALAAYAMTQGDVSGREYARWRDEERARLSEEVQALLTPQDYAAFEQFASQMDQRQLESILGNQIRMFSSGLTPENQQVVLQVAVEEFLAEQNAVWNSDAPYNQREAVVLQMRAIETLRARLVDVLPDDQYAEFENWGAIADTSLEAALPDDDEETDR